MAFLSTNLNELQYELRVPTEKILELIEIMHIMGFSSGSDSKESACNAGDPGLIPGWGRSLGEGNGYPTLVFLPGESHGQRSLVGYTVPGVTKSQTRLYG